MGTGSFPGVKSGRGVTLTPHHLLVPWSRKSRAIPLLSLFAVRSIQSLSARTRVHFTFTFFCNIYLCAWLAFSTTYRVSAKNRSIMERVKPQRINQTETLNLEHQNALLERLIFYNNGYPLRVKPLTRWRRPCSKRFSYISDYTLQVIFIPKSLLHISCRYRSPWPMFSIHTKETFKQIKLELYILLTVYLVISANNQPDAQFFFMYVCFYSPMQLQGASSSLCFLEPKVMIL